MIRGELVNLRAIERDDAETIWRWFNDPDLMHYWGQPDATTSRGAVQQRIENWIRDEQSLGHPSCFVIDDLGNVSVGVIILSDYRVNERSVLLSLLIGEQDRWGQGLGSDAMKTVIDACFSSWNLHRIELQVEAFNERAQRLYRRLGFHHEGTRRDATFMDGSYYNVEMFGLLATDWDSEDDTSA